MIKTLTALAAAALAASALSSPAAAAAPAGETIAVSYAGLDLANPADAARFDGRLKAAARDLCGEAPALDLRLSGLVEACKADVMARVRADVRLALRTGGSRTVALRTN